MLTKLEYYCKQNELGQPIVPHWPIPEQDPKTKSIAIQQFKDGNSIDGNEYLREVTAKLGNSTTCLSATQFSYSYLINLISWICCFCGGIRLFFIAKIYEIQLITIIMLSLFFCIFIVTMLTGESMWSWIVLLISVFFLVGANYAFIAI